MKRLLSRLERSHFVLFMVGAALAVAQFIMVRDFVTVLYGEEVVIVLVTAAFFAGLSAGYALALRLSRRVFEWLFIASLFLHLSFPFSYRYLAAWFAKLQLSGYAFLALLFVYALLFTAAFAAFLPRLIAAPEQNGDAVARLRLSYGMELAGFLAGFLIVGLGMNQPVSALLVLYWGLLAALLQLALGRWRLTAVFAGAAIAIVPFLLKLDFHSSALVYEYKHHQRGAQVLYSVNSPYQRVDVIETGDGERSLYLDGLQNLNSGDLQALNYYLSELPARLVRPKHALIIGNGTLSSVPVIYPYAGAVTTSELDPGVLAASRFFVDPHVLEGLDRWRLVVDDGKHFLRSNREKFDLIIMDIPSPLALQEAYLHTVEFYRLASEHLTDGGVISVMISGTLRRDDRTPARVAAALSLAFPEVMVVRGGKAGRDFAYASRRLPFTSAEVRREAAPYEGRMIIIEPKNLAGFLTKAKPLAVDTMDIVLRRGWERFSSRTF